MSCQLWKGLRLGEGSAEGAGCGENSAAPWMVQPSWPCAIRSVRCGRRFPAEFAAHVGDSQRRALWFCTPFSVEGISLWNNNYWLSSGPRLKRTTWPKDAVWRLIKNSPLCGEFYQVCWVITQVWPKTLSCNTKVVYPELSVSERKNHEWVARAMWGAFLQRHLWPHSWNLRKSRDVTLPTNIHLVKAVVFPVVTYGCESWTIKKAEHWRIDAFELWCWRRPLRVPSTARKSNQSILK